MSLPRTLLGAPIPPVFFFGVFLAHPAAAAATAAPIRIKEATKNNDNNNNHDRQTKVQETKKRYILFSCLVQLTYCRTAALGSVTLYRKETLRNEATHKKSDYGANNITRERGNHDTTTPTKLTSTTSTAHDTKGVHHLPLFFFLGLLLTMVEPTAKAKALYTAPEKTLF